MTGKCLDPISASSWTSALALCATEYVISSFVGEDVLLTALRGFLHAVTSVIGLFRGLLYMFHGADIIHDHYVGAQGHKFDVLTPGKRHHMIVSPSQIEELNRAPLNVLSLHAVAKDFLQPRDTMHGFEWDDIRGREGTGFVRALRHLLTSKLPVLRPAIYECISTEIREHLAANETSPGSGTFEPSVFEMAKTVVAKVNCLVFFGPRLTANPAFLQAAAAFPHEAAFAAEVIRILPCALTRWAARRFTRDHRAATAFYGLLHEEIQLRMQGLDDSDPPQFNDGLQWLIDTSAARKQNWDVARMVGEVMGVWYGSVHTLSVGISFALLDLYSRNDAEYVAPLRAELAAHPLRDQPGHPTDLPLLDAFLKESARLSTFEATAVRRQALRPFHFRDGPTVQPGEWVCVPTRSLMRDEARVPNALVFDPWRHLRRPDPAPEAASPSLTAKKQSFLTDSNGCHGDGTIIWGLSRITCPGRFYAALVMKLVVGIFLEEYDVTLPEVEGERSFQWRSSIVPKSSTRLRAKSRQ